MFLFHQCKKQLILYKHKINDLCGKKLTLTYLSEIKNDELFEIFTGSEDDKYYLSAKNGDDDKVCFTAMLENIK